MTGTRGEGSAFNIGSQQAGVIFNAAGDQVIHHGDGQLNLAALGAVSDLGAAVARAAPALSPTDQREAVALIGAVETELRTVQPDRHRIADALGRVARILDSVGALTTSVAAFHELASWLGAAGAGLLQLL